ncbi:MAG: Lhr family helicase [Acidimicrobiales bacterium]
MERGGVDPTRAAHARAAALLERHGVLTREAVRGEGLPGGFAAVYPVLRAMEEAGRIRRGYFIAGLGGAQFALPGAVDRLRAAREPGIDGSERGTIVLAATDPANPYGITVPWPDTPDDVSARPMRAAGAYVAMRDGQPVLWIERRGRGLAPLRAFDGEWEQDAVAAVAAMVGPGRPFKRLVVERVPDGLETVLRNAGFTPTPKGWTLYG